MQQAHGLRHPACQPALQQLLPLLLILLLRPVLCATGFSGASAACMLA
jgi:hypothetical protein